MMLSILQERKLRERSEEYCRQLQMEARSRTTSDLGSSSSLGMSSDASRLEIERLEVSAEFAVASDHRPRVGFDTDFDIPFSGTIQREIESTTRPIQHRTGFVA